MAVPSRIQNISATAANNSPTGGEAIGANLDNYLRGIQAAFRGDLAYKGSDIASAATPDIAAAQGSYHDITGTTTITGFASAEAGIWKMLQFDSAVPLINSASLALSGSSDRTTSPGEVSVVVSEGSGVWREVTNPPTSIPPGTIVDYAGSSAPSGWLLCDGSTVNRSTYAALFSAIGTTFGSGDGSTTFVLPDLRGRATFGKDDMGGSTAGRVTDAVSGIAGTTLGDAGGHQAVGAHTHGVTDPGHTHSLTMATVVNFSGSPLFTYWYPAGSTNTSSATTGISIDSGGDGDSENMPPAMILNKIIKT